MTRRRRAKRSILSALVAEALPSSSSSACFRGFASGATVGNANHPWRWLGSSGNASSFITPRVIRPSRQGRYPLHRSRGTRGYASKSVRPAPPSSRIRSPGILPGRLGRLPTATTIVAQKECVCSPVSRATNCRACLATATSSLRDSCCRVHRRRRRRRRCALHPARTETSAARRSFRPGSG